MIGVMYNISMPFKTGNIPWNIGMPAPEDVRKRMSEGQKKRYAEKPAYWLGKKFSEAHRNKLSEAMKKRIWKPASQKGIRKSEQGRRNIAAAIRRRFAETPPRTGPQASNWRGGVTSQHEKERKSPEYKAWRDAVFHRDNWTCTKCGKRGAGTLHAHHIEPFAANRDLRYELGNGTTLCMSCHRIVHSGVRIPRTPKFLHII